MQMTRSRLTAVIRWVARQETGVLLAIAVILAGTSAFVALADEIAVNGSLTIDDWGLRCVRQTGNPAALLGPEWITDAVRVITSLGGVSVLVGVNVAVAAGLAARRKFATMAFVLAAVLGGLALTMALKTCFARPRPQIVPYLCAVGGSSFPSGHSMMSAVVYLTLGTALASRAAQRRSKLLLIFLGGLLATLVGCSRICLGVHYPSDVLAGWTAGFVWAAVCWLLGRRPLRRHNV